MKEKAFERTAKVMILTQLYNC